MNKYFCYFLPLLLATLAFGKDKPERWLQVSTPHFVIISNADEGETRHIAGQFERMRLVFQTAFPQMQVDPPSPIVVIAVRNKKDFEQLEPPGYLGKGKLQIDGLFLRAPDKNYVLLRLDAEGDHPYATVYHEYTHLLTSKADAWMPLWLTEGLAEFFENTTIHEKDVLLGEPSPGNIFLLQQKRLLPLATLLSVDYNSPYYHEEDKGNIFYAESWALTQYLKVSDFRANTHHLSDYVGLVSQGVNPVTAARQAFGDLQQVQKLLDAYVQRDGYRYAFRLAAPINVDESVFKAQSITNSAADAHRADLMAYENRYDDSRSLASEVLQEDPNNTLAHETMGYLEFRQNHFDEALKWFREAVKLDSQSYLANYYFAAISINKGGMDSTQEAEVERSLQNSIKLNPSYAPSYDGLALLYKRQHRNLNDAYRAELQAVELDPADVNYRMNAAGILVDMEQYANAINVIKATLKVAKTTTDLAQAQLFLSQIQNVEQETERQKEVQKEMQESARALSDHSGRGGAEDESSDSQPPALNRRPAAPHGTRHFMTGIIKKVRCSEPSMMEFNLDTGSKVFQFYSANYYHIEFTALNFTPKGDLEPCTQLEGVRGKVEFVTDNGPPARNYAIAIEMQH